MSALEGGAYVASLVDSMAGQSTQGQLLTPLITGQTAGAQKLSVGGLLIPPGAISKAQIHVKQEIIVVCVQGWAATLLGDNLFPVVHGPGECVFIPPGLVHIAVNLSTSERVVAVEARSNPAFNADVMLKPSLEASAERIAASLRASYADGLLRSLVDERPALPQRLCRDARWKPQPRRGLRH